MEKIKRERIAWAIDSRSHEIHGFIGMYWWFDGEPPKIPNHMLGTGTALFRTRQMARDALPCVKNLFPKARVIKVVVSICDYPNEKGEEDETDTPI